MLTIKMKVIIATVFTKKTNDEQAAYGGLEYYCFYDAVTAAQAKKAIEKMVFNGSKKVKVCDLEKLKLEIECRSDIPVFGYDRSISDIISSELNVMGYDDLIIIPEIQEDEEVQEDE